MNILDKVQLHFTTQKPFVVFRHGNSDILSGLFMHSSSLIFSNDFKEDGFVFAPFLNVNNTIFFSKKEGEFLEEELGKTTDKNLFNSEKKVFMPFEKQKHIALVNKAINTIKKERVKKIVVSRKESVPFKKENFVTVFKRLLSKYKTAFVYVWYHPKVGLWLGATPETLLHVANNQFTTMSLAGTKSALHKQKASWTSKEYEEQKMVTDFIVQNLKNKVVGLKTHDLQTIKAGNLFHLQTKITGNITENTNLKTIIEALHPTPAICGLPRDLSKDFIVKNENYNREFYSGFLGEINSKNKSTTIYVNLRCMQVTDKSAIIYVGGGITKDSNAEDEWLETVSKSKTMKSVLEK